MTSLSVRYIVDDVEEAISAFTEHLGCTLQTRYPGSGFASLQEVICGCSPTRQLDPEGASQALPDGRKPEPGGWEPIPDRDASTWKPRCSGRCLGCAVSQ